MNRRSLIAGLVATPVVMKASIALAQAESDNPLCYASVDDLTAMFRARKASPVDLLKAQIKRIEALNSKINCITYEHFDQALKEAQQSEDRYRRGDARPLEGITVAIKDEFSRPGWRTTQGSLIFKELAARNGKRSRHRLARGGWRCHVVPDDGAGILPLPRRLDPRLGHDP